MGRKLDNNQSPIQKSLSFGAYIDTGVDMKRVKMLEKKFSFYSVRGHNNENRISVSELVPQPFTIGESMIGGPDLLADNNIHDVNTIIGKHNRADIKHVYSAYMHPDCKYFITNNPADFIYESKKKKDSQKKRDELEKVLPGLRIVTIDEFESILNTKS